MVNQTHNDSTTTVMDNTFVVRKPIGQHGFSVKVNETRGQYYVIAHLYGVPLSNVSTIYNQDSSTLTLSNGVDSVFVTFGEWGVDNSGMVVGFKYIPVDYTLRTCTYDSGVMRISLPKVDVGESKTGPSPLSFH
jgi:HSP20 family molecular chaperone IbpA